jgi:hypothetical protein
MGKAAWPEIERLLGEIRQALDQMTLDEDALILEATVETTESSVKNPEVPDF